MKRVFMIGDSIRIGYCEAAAAALEGTAQVQWPACNCMFAQNVYVSMPWWAASAGSPETVDLVCWNCGHWDTAHWMKDEDGALNSPEEYAGMIGRIARRVKQVFPNAKQMFFTTTYREEGAEMEHPRSNEEIRLYNETACRVLAPLGVTVSDMAAFSLSLGADRFADGIHFTPEAFAALGRYAAEAVRGMLDA